MPALTKILSGLVLLIIFLTPITPTFLNFGWEESKVILFLSLLSISIIFFLLSRRKLHLNLSLKLSLSLIIVLILTSLFGLNFLNSLTGQPPFYQGLVVFLYLWLLSLLIFSTRLSLTSIAKALALSCIVISVIAIKDYLLLNLVHLPIPTYNGRVVSTFGQPSWYAGFLLISLPLIYWLYQSSNPLWKSLAKVSLVLSALSIFISFSLTSITLLLGLILLTLLKHSLTKLLLATLLSLLATYLIVSSDSLLQTHFNNLVYREFIQPFHPQINDPSYSSEKRILIYYLATLIISQNFIGGVGLANIYLAFKSFDYFNYYYQVNPSIALYRIKDLNITSTHNLILDILLQSGVLGLIFWWLVVAALFLKSGSQPLRYSLSVYLVWSQFQLPSIAHLMFFWIILGLISQSDS